MSAEFYRTKANVQEKKAFVDPATGDFSTPIEIDAFEGLDRKRKGYLVAHLHKTLDISQDSQTMDSYILLNYIGVPRAKENGLGTLLLKRLKEEALNLGATRIVGVVSPVLIKEQRFLLDFYRRNGFDFSLNPVDNNYDLVQNLSPNN